MYEEEALELRQPFGLPRTYETARPEVAEAVAVLAAAHPRQPIQEETVKVYVAALSDIDPERLADAVEFCVITMRSFPTISDIRRRVAEAELGLPTPQQALVEVSKAICDGTSIVPTPLVLEAARAVGVDSQIHDQNPAGVWRGQFLKTYSGLWEARILERMLRRGNHDWAKRGEHKT